MDQQALLPQARLGEFVAFLAARQKLIGPVALGYNQYKFAEVTSLEELSLDYLPTILPPKKYFLPYHERLLSYDLSDGQGMEPVVEVEDITLFGLHTCDLAGIQCLNMVFSDHPRDLHYLTRKHHMTLIGLECTDYCDHYANCAMLRTHLPKGGYDLFMTEMNDHYYVDVNTYTGEVLVREADLFERVTPLALKELRSLRDAKKKIFQNELPIRYQDMPKLFDDTCDSEVWTQVGDKCLACGNCTNVCPTCYCFDMADEPELGLTRGHRVRIWDSCQHETFAEVAGGENFRGQRSERQRHRFNRKFHFPLERYKRVFCTGCGRCSRSCMAGIDLKETLNALIDERS
ncbi:MAG: 4Fe-4S dicluster domain-containing protein [Desulfuromonadales bacterium]|nr:4Fe-4S dicluster domain-containing protein [Desulfuromonadales bacterium]MBN2791844.1 4Fe-4S dicluster domain-containing protein [Desulfuromonadales bacterium]